LLRHRFATHLLAAGVDPRRIPLLQQEHHLVGRPPALPASDQPQGLCVLTERRFNYGPSIIGIGRPLDRTPSRSSPTPRAGTRPCLWACA
jgi:hypothetical protein